MEENLKKNGIKAKIQYKFDNLMAKGSIALVGVLFLATAVVSILVGLLLIISGSGGEGLGSNVWLSIMHIIDAGTITGAETDRTDFIILMSIATICGLFVTSILIGIITTGFESKLETLRKGNSRVIEENHTVILGFSSNIYTIISELILANESEKNPKIVILAKEDKEEVEVLIANHVKDFKNTKIICRTGSIYDVNMLEKCSLETSKSIIVNESQDFNVVKCVIAVNSYLKEHGIEGQLPFIVCTVRSKSNFNAIQNISLGNVEVLIVDDFIARIIAQTCRQPGLTNVLFELFDFDGDELYFEKFTEICGKEFGEVLLSFEKAIVFGYKRGDEIKLNPHPKTVLQKDDELILLMADNGSESPKEYICKGDLSAVASQKNIEGSPETVAVIGTNRLLNKVILELDDFAVRDSKLLLVNPGATKEDVPVIDRLKNISIQFMDMNIEDVDQLNKLMENDIDYILLLSDDEKEEEESDARTLVSLINIRDIIKREKRELSITSELRVVQNQKLAQITKVNDLVIGSDIINLLMSQISENRNLTKVFREILDAEGSEIYITPAMKHIETNEALTFYDITRVMAEKGQIAVGYKKVVGESFEIITNPKKSDILKLEDKDGIIVLANG